MKVMPRFRTGRLLVTRGVADQQAEDTGFAVFVAESLGRHMRGDWGDLGPEDKAENERSLVHGWRLLSAYEHEGQPSIWIITEADRSATTVLFPQEY